MKGTKTWFNYLPLSTVGQEIKDDGSRVFCAVPISREADGFPPLELAIIGSPERLELIRVTTPETDGDLTAEERHQIGSIVDHVLAVIRLLFDRGLDRLYVIGKPFAFGQFAKDDGSPQLSVNIKEFGEPVKFNSKQLQDAIVATAPMRVHLSLLAEASHYATPVSFKYLCYYKILELELRINRTWVGLAEHLAEYESAYGQLKIGTAKLANFIHSYRDKCAHIRTGSRDELGLVGMGSRDAETVSKFLPLFNKIVIELLNKKYGDRILLSPGLEAEPVEVSPDQLPEILRS